MATIPAAVSRSEGPTESVEQQFRRLANTWKSAVALLSSSTARESHPAYQEIIGLGDAVVPFLLRDLEQNNTHWFAALHVITGADPIQAADAGNIPRMRDAWVRWALANGYRW